jgi:hypothetical protein
MRVQSCLLVLLAVLIIGGGADEPHYVRLPGPGPAVIPPPPSHPKIEGDVNSVSSADIREVIWLKQQDMVKDYGRALPIYTVRVHSKNHIEVQYWGADGVQFWRDARRAKGRWKFDGLVPVTLAVADVARARLLPTDLTNR